MSGESIYDQTVETMARVGHDAYEHAAVEAGWETQQRSRVDWDDLPPENRQTMLAAYRAALDALLAARDAQTCPTCGGAKEIGHQYRFPPNPPGYHFDPCPDCTDGTVDHGPLLVRLLQDRGMLEQVGWGAESAIPKWSGNQHLFGWWYGEAREKDHYVDYDPTRQIVPLFRVVDPAGS